MASKKASLVMGNVLSLIILKTTDTELRDDRHPPANSPSASSIPADDLTALLTVADPDSADVPHISVAGGTYTVLVSRAQTADAIASSTCSCPPAVDPRRIATTSRRCFRCSKANSSSLFVESRTRYARDRPSTSRPTPRTRSRTCPARRRACSVCVAPAGQDEFFLAVGFPVEGRTSPPPKPTPEDMAEEGKLIAALLPKYRTETGQDVTAHPCDGSHEWMKAVAQSRRTFFSR